MAATLSISPEQQLAHCTGRFDYVLPASLQSTGGQRNLYLIDAVQVALPAGASAVGEFKARLASTMASKSTSGAALLREFNLGGVGPAAWLRLAANRPDLVTLLAMKPVPEAGVAVYLQIEASAGREAVAESVFPKLAATYAAGSPQGFCSGAGAFVIAPSINERAFDSFAAIGVSISVETETVSAPDDGQSSDGDPPPGGKVLVKHRRSVAGFDGIEQLVQLPGDGGGTRLVFTWIFAGRAADGATPRIRFAGSAVGSHVASLDAAWNALLATWRPRPLSVR